MYAQLCSSTNEIFTSVVVYSRTTNPKNHKKKIMLFVSANSKNDFETMSALKRKKRSCWILAGLVPICIRILYPVLMMEQEIWLRLCN